MHASLIQPCKHTVCLISSCAICQYVNMWKSNDMLLITVQNYLLIQKWTGATQTHFNTSTNTDRNGHWPCAPPSPQTGPVEVDPGQNWCPSPSPCRLQVLLHSGCTQNSPLSPFFLHTAFRYPTCTVLSSMAKLTCTGLASPLTVAKLFLPSPELSQMLTNSCLHCGTEPLERIQTQYTCLQNVCKPNL